MDKMIKNQIDQMNQEMNLNREGMLAYRFDIAYSRMVQPCMHGLILHVGSGL